MYLIGARSILKEEMDVLRQWVQAGGTLVAGNQTSRCDQWGRPLADYQLSDMFGASFDTTLSVDLKDRSEQGGNNLFSLSSGGTKIDIDRVKLKTGKVEGNWNDEGPAVVRNTFGKGACVFITARSSKMQAMSEGVDDDKKESYFFSLAAKAIGKSHMSFENCPKAVEVSMRLQPARQRRVIHLFNHGYDARQDQPVNGVKMIIEDKSKYKFYYPTDREPVECVNDRQSQKYILSIRGFRLHEVVVAELLTP